MSEDHHHHNHPSVSLVGMCAPVCVPVCRSLTCFPDSSGGSLDGLFLELLLLLLLRTLLPGLLPHLAAFSPLAAAKASTYTAPTQHTVKNTTVVLVDGRSASVQQQQAQQQAQQRYQAFAVVQERYQALLQHGSVTKRCSSTAALPGVAARQQRYSSNSGSKYSDTRTTAVPAQQQYPHSSTAAQQ